MVSPNSNGTQTKTGGVYAWSQTLKFSSGLEASKWFHPAIFLRPILWFLRLTRWLRSTCKHKLEMASASWPFLVLVYLSCFSVLISPCFRIFELFQCLDFILFWYIWVVLVSWLHLVSVYLSCFSVLISSCFSIFGLFQFIWMIAEDWET